MRRIAPLLLVALLAAPGRAQAGPLAALRRADALLDAGQVEDAAAAITALAALAPSDPGVQYLRGKLAFYQGDYKQAVVELDAAAKAGITPARDLEKVAAGAAGVTDGFVADESPGGHFVLWHKKGKDDLLVPYAGLALEKQYAALAADLGYAPPGKVRVEIYESADDLSETTSLTAKEIETSGTIAICKWNRVMVTSPRALMRGYPWMDTLAHEYTHFVETRASADRAPLWLQEGVAKFEEQRWRSPTGSPMDAESETLLARALARNEWISFAAMHPSLAKLPSQEAAALAFAEVRSIVEYVVARKGYGALRGLFAELAKGVPEGRALEDVLGEDADGLWADWKSWIAGRGLRLHPGVAPPKMKFAVAAGTGGGQKDSDQDGVDDIAEAGARKAARLGGLLRTHRRLAAAAVEYEKAYAVLGPASEPIASRLARTYLEIGEPGRAIATARPTSALYPEMAGPHVTLGAAYLALGDDANAEGELWAALRVSPFDPSVHCGLARVYEDRGDRPSATREEGFCVQLGGKVPPPATPRPPTPAPPAPAAR